MNLGEVLTGTGYLCAPLHDDHFLMGFECGYGGGLSAWLRSHAPAYQREHLCQVWVLSPNSHPDTVTGYFALSPHTVIRDTIRRRDRYTDTRNANEVTSLPRVPATLLGKFALDQGSQGIGLGTLLMACVYAVHLAATRHVGGKFLVVEAREPALVSYYEQAFHFIRASQTSTSMVTLYRPTTQIEADLLAS